MRFLTDEAGAGTVEWTLLTAALVGLALSVMTVVSDGTEDLSGDMNAELVAADAAPAF